MGALWRTVMAPNCLGLSTTPWYQQDIAGPHSVHLPRPIVPVSGRIGRHKQPCPSPPRCCQNRQRNATHRAYGVGGLDGVVGPHVRTLAPLSPYVAATVWRVGGAVKGGSTLFAIVRPMRSNGASGQPFLPSTRRPSCSIASRAGEAAGCPWRGRDAGVAETASGRRRGRRKWRRCRRRRVRREDRPAGVRRGFGAALGGDRQPRIEDADTQPPPFATRLWGAAARFLGSRCEAASAGPNAGRRRRRSARRFPKGASTTCSRSCAATPATNRRLTEGAHNTSHTRDGDGTAALRPKAPWASFESVSVAHREPALGSHRRVRPLPLFRGASAVTTPDAFASRPRPRQGDVLRFVHDQAPVVAQRQHPRHHTVAVADCRPRDGAPHTESRWATCVATLSSMVLRLDVPKRPRRFALVYTQSGHNFGRHRFRNARCGPTTPP